MRLKQSVIKCTTLWVLNTRGGAWNWAWMTGYSRTDYDDSNCSLYVCLYTKTARLKFQVTRHIFPFHFYIYVTCKIFLHRDEPWHGKDTETAPLHFQWFDLRYTTLKQCRKCGIMSQQLHEFVETIKPIFGVNLGTHVGSPGGCLHLDQKSPSYTCHSVVHQH